MIHENRGTNTVQRYEDGYRGIITVSERGYQGYGSRNTVVEVKHSYGGKKKKGERIW